MDDYIRIDRLIVEKFILSRVDHYLVSHSKFLNKGSTLCNRDALAGYIKIDIDLSLAGKESLTHCRDLHSFGYLCTSFEIVFQDFSISHRRNLTLTSSSSVDCLVMHKDKFAVLCGTDIKLHHVRSGSDSQLDHLDGVLRNIILHTLESICPMRHDVYPLARNISALLLHELIEQCHQIGRSSRLLSLPVGLFLCASAAGEHQRNRTNEQH